MLFKVLGSSTHFLESIKGGNKNSYGVIYTLDLFGVMLHKNVFMHPWFQIRNKVPFVDSMEFR